MATPDVPSPFQSPSIPLSSGIPVLVPSSPMLPPISPQKRPPQSSATPDQNKSKKQKVETRGTRLLSYAYQQSVGAFHSADERLAAAIEAAKSLDARMKLPPEDTIVTIRDTPHSSQSEQFEHTNSSNWENSRLQAGALDSQVWQGFRCFLDAFYYYCHYIPVWEQNRSIPYNPLYPTHVQAVHRSLSELAEFGITINHLPYLVGPDSLYEESHQPIHNLPLTTVGAAMSKWCRECTLEDRVQSYRLVWKYLTGYDDWSDGEFDDRTIGSSGVVQKRRPNETTPIEYSAERMGVQEESFQ